MKKKSILRHIQEQGTFLLNKYKNKRVSKERDKNPV